MFFKAIDSSAVATIGLVMTAAITGITTSNKITNVSFNFSSGSPILPNERKNYYKLSHQHIKILSPKKWCQINI